MRPGGMLSLTEKDINVDIGALFIHKPKEKKPKIIFLLNDDIELINQFPRSLPDLLFFRHPSGIKGAAAGAKFGDKYLYNAGKKALPI